MFRPILQAAGGSLGQLKTASQEEPLSLLGLFCQLPPGFLVEGKGGRFEVLPWLA